MESEGIEGIYIRHKKKNNRTVAVVSIKTGEGIVEGEEMFQSRNGESHTPSNIILVVVVVGCGIGDRVVNDS